ncbi:Uncharacterised protein [Burkholderia pseudomallei]|nr:Uncharacterised protein [Burkholderia pseudomallei]CAJ3934433.1 Uncharacterised protein [Burkholderia pseudomallei]CAJ4997604.1 Uncharacterised protein [Burkholderia pseudomallei]CAJ5860031.1 Uncharacterised protein [Burkholderia pseudomallei]CAJ6281668.1 Uncharacterised protein [Burkholderia pseudomallei]
MRSGSPPVRSSSRPASASTRSPSAANVIVAASMRSAIAAGHARTRASKRAWISGEPVRSNAVAFQVRVTCSRSPSGRHESDPTDASGIAAICSSSASYCASRPSIELRANNAVAYSIVHARPS